MFKLLISAFLIGSCWAQFPLPNVPLEAPKPTVPKELANFFSIQPGADNLFNSLFAGFVPPPNFNVPGRSAPRNVVTQGAFGGGGGGGTVPGLSINRISDASGNGSSVAGIPDILPTLPKAPLPSSGDATSAFGIPGLSAAGSGPNGLAGAGSGLDAASLSALLGSGLNPGAALGTSGVGLGTSGLGLGGSPVAAAGASPFGLGGAQTPFGLAGQSATGGDNLISQLLKSIGLQDVAPNLDLNAVNGLLGINNQQDDFLSSVLYSALTDSSTLNDAAAGSQQSPEQNRANAALIQNLLSQSTSPLCNPKPQPVEKFDLSAFLGKYYQVVYSPPMSLGPCSMITFSRLSNIANDGPGTVFNLFEYTTEGTPTGKPSISSGYAIIRAPGQLTFRTSNNPTDLNVYVLETGPLDELGRYEYMILAVNCNYPIYVYARDPMKYKQKYEQIVNGLLEQRGLATSWARLFNVVASVDYNLCSFPPTLFNVHQ